MQLQSVIIDKQHFLFLKQFGLQQNVQQDENIPESLIIYLRVPKVLFSDLSCRSCRSTSEVMAHLIYSA
jgi:hypothetical protein